MRLLLTITLIACGTSAALDAQWYVGTDLGAMRYRGSAHDTTASQVDTRPDGGAMVSLRVGHRWPRWDGALRLSYARVGFTLGANGLMIVNKGTGNLLEMSPLISTRVGGIGPSGAVWLEVGPALHLWDFDGEQRARLGLVAATAYEWQVVNRLTGSVRLEGSLSSSWFDARDVPPEFERHATWRYGVGLGLRYRLSGG